MPSSVTLPPLPVFPPSPCGDGTDNPSINPLPTPENSPGNGNLLYVTTLKGLAVCTQAFGTDGSDGAPTWFSANGVSPNNLTGDALKIRWFDLDPWSIDPSGDHFTAGWAMTDAGLCRVTGLPDAPVWTLQLTRAAAFALIGSPTGDVSRAHLSWNFSPSVRKAGFVATLLVMDCGYYSAPWNVGYGGAVYVIYSLDYGATWNATAADWMYVAGVGVVQAIAQSIHIDPSWHLDDVYYVGGGTSSGYARPSIGDQTNLVYGGPTVLYMRSPGSRGGAFPDFSPGMSDGLAVPTDSFGRMLTPYCDVSGNVYADDSRIYTFDSFVTSNGGINSIRRFVSAFNPLWSLGYTPPSNVSIGDAAMPGQICWLFSSMFKEDYAVAIDPSNLWFTGELSGVLPAWLRKNNPTISSRVLSPTYLYMVPSSLSTVFFTGKRVSGGVAGYALPCFTPNFGTTLIDISKPGVADGIDAVMGLSSTIDLGGSLILVDRRFVGGGPSVASAKMIDVAHYQGTMNWVTAHTAGITHAFIKASQGASYVDPQFATNWSGAYNQSIERGAYHFYVAGVDPTVQADNLMNVMNGDYGELGPAADFEEIDEHNPNNDTPENVKIFLDRIETVSGMRCTIYTRASWWNLYMGSQPWVMNYPLWVAHYNVSVPTLPSGWTEYWYWQYSSLAPGATYGAQSSNIDVDKIAGGVG
jgi:lysozyme